MIPAVNDEWLLDIGCARFVILDVASYDGNLNGTAFDKFNQFLLTACLVVWF